MSEVSCRVAVLSVHTSQVEQPGWGDAGGMNVYIREVALDMARRGVRSDIFTRRTDPDTPDVQEITEGVRVFAFRSGPMRPVHKDVLPRVIRRFTDTVTEFGPYD